MRSLERAAVRAQRVGAVHVTLLAFAAAALALACACSAGPAHPATGPAAPAPTSARGATPPDGSAPTPGGADAPPVTSSAPPGASTLAPPSFPDAPATVTLVGPTCGLGDGEWLRLHPDVQILRGCCGGRCFARVVDAEGALGPPLPHTLGAPMLAVAEETRLFQGTWPDQAWLAVERESAHLPPRLAIHEHTRAGWASRYVGPADGWNIREIAVGLGRWPGAVIGLVRTDSRMFPAGQRIEVLRGRPDVALPRLPDPDEHPVRAWATLASGHAFGLAAEGERVTLLRWTPASPEPAMDERPDLRPLTPDPRISVEVIGPDEAYALGESPDDPAFVVVVRFDGTRWVRSARLPGAVVLGFHATPGGALWLLTRGPGPALWRRAPGPGDRWASVAASSIGEDEAIMPSAIAPAGDHDVLLLGMVATEGYGVYRVHVDGEASRGAVDAAVPAGAR